MEVCKYCGKRTFITNFVDEGGVAHDMAYPYTTATDWHDSADCVTEDRS